MTVARRAVLLEILRQQRGGWHFDCSLCSVTDFDSEEINALLARCEEHLLTLKKERRLTRDALPAFRELADALERRVGPADRRHKPRQGDGDRRVSHVR